MVLCERTSREWYRQRVWSDSCTGVQRNLIKILDSTSKNFVGVRQCFPISDHNLNLSLKIFPYLYFKNIFRMGAIAVFSLTTKVHFVKNLHDDSIFVFLLFDLQRFEWNRVE